MKNNIKILIKQFNRFAIIGLINTILNLTITYFLIFCLKNIILEKTTLTFIASSFGFILTTLNSYFLNNYFVFKKTKKGNLWPLTKTYLCYSFTFILSFVLTKLFTNIIHVSVLFVPIISLILTVPLNFFINKFWSFS